MSSAVRLRHRVVGYSSSATGNTGRATTPLPAGTFTLLAIAVSAMPFPFSSSPARMAFFRLNALFWRLTSHSRQLFVHGLCCEPRQALRAACDERDSRISDLEVQALRNTSTLKMLSSALEVRRGGGNTGVPAAFCGLLSILWQFCLDLLVFASHLMIPQSYLNLPAGWGGCRLVTSSCLLSCRSPVLPGLVLSIRDADEEQHTSTSTES